MVRCFIAIDVDDQGITEKILKLQEELNSLDMKFKFVEPENIHLTLKFLGEITDSQVEKVKELLRDLKFSSFTLRFRGIGTFPNHSRPRVIWVGVSEGATEFSELAKRVDASLRKLGFPPETRGFKPHLTIARVKRGGGTALSNLIQAYSLEDFGTLKVNSVKLKRSTLTPRGPVYTTLYEGEASQE